MFLDALEGSGVLGQRLVGVLESFVVLLTSLLHMEGSSGNLIPNKGGSVSRQNFGMLDVVIAMQVI